MTLILMSILTLALFLVGPIHQFTHNACPWSWPLFQTGTCSVNSNARVNITIDGLKIIRPNGIPGYEFSDFMIMGNNATNTTVTLKNIEVDGKVKTCDTPPASITDFGGDCNNACFAANVVSDGSYDVKCTSWDDGYRTVAKGKCAPLMGSIDQRCASGNATKTKLCYSGLECA